MTPMCYLCSQPVVNQLHSGTIAVKNRDGSLSALQIHPFSSAVYGGKIPDMVIAHLKCFDDYLERKSLPHRPDVGITKENN